MSNINEKFEEFYDKVSDLEINSVLMTHDDIEKTMISLYKNYLPENNYKGGKSFSIYDAWFSFVDEDLKRKFLKDYKNICADASHKK